MSIGTATKATPSSPATTAVRSAARTLPPQGPPRPRSPPLHAHNDNPELPARSPNAPGPPPRTAVILSPFRISPSHEAFLRLRHVAYVMLCARLRSQKRSDEKIDAGHVGVIASVASYTPLKITRPPHSSKARKATWETPQSGLEITAGTCAGTRRVKLLSVTNGLYDPLLSVGTVRGCHRRGLGKLVIDKVSCLFAVRRFRRLPQRPQLHGAFSSAGLVARYNVSR